MSFVSTALLALSMSADAFAAAVGKGTHLKHPKIRDAAKIGLIFGVTEGVAPLIGWLAGIGANRYVVNYDHWIAFLILCAIGIHMIAEGFQTAKADDKPEALLKKSHKKRFILITAMGTSIDSVAVGVSLALLSMNIWITAAAIGTATFAMATLGIMIGHHIGKKGGRIAVIVGGTGLILIGTKILLTHLGVLG